MFAISRQSTGRGGGQQSAAPDGLRLYVIGDIHGRRDCLEDLIEQIGVDWETRPAPSCRVIFMGDYIDRGPDSAGVLNLLEHFSATSPACIFLKGNHEELLEAFIEDPAGNVRWFQHGGLETLRSFRVALPGTGQKSVFQMALALKAAIPDRQRAFLSNLPSHVSFGDYFFCHAGVKPGVPLDKQAPGDLLWIRDEFLSCETDFGMVVVHGHTPVTAPEFRPNRINVDTGAFASGILTALVLEGADRRLLQSKLAPGAPTGTIVR